MKTHTNRISSRGPALPSISNFQPLTLPLAAVLVLLASSIAVAGNPPVASYSLTSNSPQTAGSAITVTITALSGIGNPIPNSSLPADIALSITGATGTVTYGNGTLTVSNIADNNATIATAGNSFDGNGQGTFTVTHTVSQTVTLTANDGTRSATTPLTWDPGAANPVNSTITPASSTVTANGSDAASLTITLRDANGNLVPSRTIELITISGASLTISPASATSVDGNADGAETFTVASAVVQTATFRGRDQASGVLTDGTAEVQFVPGAAASLRFVQQPTNTEAGSPITPAVTIEVLDATNNRVTTATNPVTIAIGAGSPSGTLTGGGEQTSASGVATFDNLRIDTAGAGYVLTATSPDLSSATSDSFDVTAGANTNLNDSDGDGLSDAEERAGFTLTRYPAGSTSGRFSPSLVVRVFCDPFNADTDGDGTNDWNEVNTWARQAASDGSVPSIGLAAFSARANLVVTKPVRGIRTDPTLGDTDSDNIPDIVDPAPQVHPIRFGFTDSNGDGLLSDIEAFAQGATDQFDFQRKLLNFDQDGDGFLEAPDANGDGFPDFTAYNESTTEQLLVVDFSNNGNLLDGNDIGGLGLGAADTSSSGLFGTFRIVSGGDGTLNDADSTGVLIRTDNCPRFQNPAQLDFDGDGLGDDCDADRDNDGIPNGLDFVDQAPLGVLQAPRICGISLFPSLLLTFAGLLGIRGRVRRPRARG